MSSNSPTMKLKLISITGEILNEDIYGVVLPTKSGEITVLPDHEPLVTLLSPGAMAIRRNKADSDRDIEFFAVTGGVVEISDDEVVVLADEAESDRDIAEAEAKDALDRAHKAQAEAKDQQELEEAKKMVSHQSARLKVAGLRRRYRK